MTPSTALVVIPRARRPRRDRRKALRLIGASLPLGSAGINVHTFQFPSGATGRFYPGLRDRIRLAKQHQEAHETRHRS